MKKDKKYWSFVQRGWAYKTLHDDGTLDWLQHFSYTKPEVWDKVVELKNWARRVAHNKPPLSRKAVQALVKKEGGKIVRVKIVET